MRTCPFKRSPQRLPWLDARMAAAFERVRRDALDRLDAAVPVEDYRRGFGIVSASGPLMVAGMTLSWWNWRAAGAEHLPPGVGGRMFFDDPLGAAPSDRLGRRGAAAEAFAAAANVFFDPEDASFTAHPVEVVRKDGSLSERVAAEDGSHVIAIDLLPGHSNRRAIGRLIRDEHGGDLRRAVELTIGASLRVAVWRRAERVNAARDMFGLATAPIRVPGLPALLRMAEAQHAELLRKSRGLAPASA